MGRNRDIVIIGLALVIGVILTLLLSIAVLFYSLQPAIETSRVVNNELRGNHAVTK